MTTVAFPPFRLDTDEGRLWKGDTPLVLRRKPFAILAYLAAHPGKLVTHDELLAQVWGGVVVSDSAMRSHMHELRQVLGEGVIETVIGRGYRFVAKLDAHVAVEPLARHAVELQPLIVGREREIETLRAAFERARSGRRQLCFVTGEPGIGKSTLVRAFVAGLDRHNVIVARGACFEQHGTPEPYLPIIEALTSVVRSERGTQALATLVRYSPTFVAQLPHLLDDTQREETARRAAGGNESRQLRELCEALEALCTREPLVLVLEDLQWSDVATIDLLALLGRREERSKLLVIGTSRHAEVQRREHPLHHVMRSLIARTGAIALPVSKIGTTDVQAFIDERFVGHCFPSQLTQLVASITDGTPLFMVALLDELADRGMVAQHDGRWALTVAIDEVQAHRPSSVKQLIDMQLDRLSADEQRILEAASIVGAEFSTTLVAAALELPAEEVDDVCDALARRSLFLRREPAQRYSVTHALVQEVCLERSSPVRRQRWHRRVAEALEREPQAGDIAHVLAKHFEEADDAKRAIDSYLIAASNAAQRYAASDTVAMCARALDLLPRLPPSAARDRTELKILDTMCRQVSSNSFSAAFAGRDPMAVYDRAIEIARSFNDAALLYAAITERCNYNMIIAQYASSAALMAELEQIERQHPELDPALLHAGIFARGYIAFFSGQLGVALDLFAALAADDVGSVFRDNVGGRALALGHLACATWVVGEPDRALAQALSALQLADQIKVPVLQALGHVVRARLRFLRRDPWPVVEQEATEAVRAATVDLGLLAEAKAIALWVQARRAPLELATIAPMLDGLQQRLSEVSTSSTLVGLVLIDVLRLSGHRVEARALTDQIIAFAQTHHETVYLPELLRVRGEQRQDVDPAGAALDYREALALARTTGAYSLQQRAADSLSALEA